MGKHLGKFMEKKSRELTIDSQEFLPKVKKKKKSRKGSNRNKGVKEKTMHTHAHTIL